MVPDSQTYNGIGVFFVSLPEPGRCQWVELVRARERSGNDDIRSLLFGALGTDDESFERAPELDYSHLVPVGRYLSVT